jgi:hypothetical protein
MRRWQCLGEDAHGGGMGYRTNEDHQGSAIQILSLATLMASKPVSEYAPGAEKSLFASEAAVLDQFPLIIMEPHDWMFPGEHTSVEFFRFHSQAGREFAMKHENVASIACNAGMCGTE